MGARFSALTLRRNRSSLSGGREFIIISQAYIYDTPYIYETSISESLGFVDASAKVKRPPIIESRIMLKRKYIAEKSEEIRIIIGYIFLKPDVMMFIIQTSLA